MKFILDIDVDEIISEEDDLETVLNKTYNMIFAPTIGSLLIAAGEVVSSEGMDSEEYKQLMTAYETLKSASMTYAG